jgi:uncharacterized repeat protein (TIGR02543 family)
MKVNKLIKLVLAFALSICTVNSIEAQTLQAIDDSLATGPIQSIKKNIILNDIIPCDNATWQIDVMPNPVTQGTLTRNGDVITFTPSVASRGTTVVIPYTVRCHTSSSSANIVIEVHKYDLPANIVTPTTNCWVDMPVGVNFSPVEKYHTSEDINLDGFSLPMVGDITGDGKPEIVALGLGYDGDSFTAGSGLAGRAQYVHIFDGQTGARLWTVALGTTYESKYSPTVTTLYHDGISGNANESNDQFQLRYNPRHNSPAHIAIADLDNDGVGEIVVAEVGSKGQIYCLKPILKGARRIAGFSKMWMGNNRGAQYNYKTPISDNHEQYGAGVPYIADINADGTPEVIIYNKIFNGRTGQIECVIEQLADFDQPTTESAASTIMSNFAFVGRQPQLPNKDNYTPCMVIADINQDGILDIVAGSKVYIMKDNNGKPALDRVIKGPTSFTVQATTNKNTTQTVFCADGFTAVGDIDGDGSLDVVVINVLNRASNNNIAFYVWDPMKNPTYAKGALKLYQDGWEGTVSYPFLGDINGKLDDVTGKKKLPEICFITGRLWTKGANNSTIIKAHPRSTGTDATKYITVDNAGLITNSRFNSNSNRSTVAGFVLGFTFHGSTSTPLGERLKMSWVLEHIDRSQQTGITMFDFDNDGVQEICYKDESSIRVISPARQNYITIDETRIGGTAAVRFMEDNISSYTGWEAPVIADVNMDGSADIITMNYPYEPSGFHSYSYIYVWEHAPGTSSWTPAPPVWNQALYNPLYIREDLTVPSKPESMLKKYVNTAGESITPYNGQWVQQPIVKSGSDVFKPIVRHPDAHVSLMKASSTASSTTIQLTILNKGEASINANTPITFRDGGSAGKPIEQSPIIKSVLVGVDIFREEKVVLTFSLSGNYQNHLIWARVMENSSGFPATNFYDCDLTNNTASAIDCPYMNYTVEYADATDTVLCGQYGVVPLIATPAEAPHYTPTYQWYRNDEPIQGATSQIYTASLSGEYKCYVIEDVCRGFTTSRMVVRSYPVTHDDSTATTRNHPVLIPVFDNDKLPVCHIESDIAIMPLHGTAKSVNGRILYTPAPDFVGTDSLTYSIEDSAVVRISVLDFPANVIDPTCRVTPANLPVSIREAGRSTQAVSNICTPVAGDVDGDGRVEIVALEGNDDTYSTVSNIYVFDDNLIVKYTISLRAPVKGISSPLALADVNGDGKAEIFVAAADGRLYKYSFAGGSTFSVTYAEYTNNTAYYYCQPMITDFNGDGMPEVVVLDKVFDANTMTLLADGKRIAAGGNLGMGGGHPATGTSGTNNANTSVMAIADVDGDGLPEIVAGATVYKVRITNRTGTANNSFSVLKQASTAGHPEVGDGYTAVADMDMDGMLDVVVSRRTGNNTAALYIWNPRTGDVINTNPITNLYAYPAVANEGAYGPSVPAIGDIDGDGAPEIIIVSNADGTTTQSATAGMITAYDFANGTLTPKWSQTHSDHSASSGVTMFDFNGDGSMELIHRDITHLRILNATNGTTIATDECSSATAIEYPIVVDYNSDGVAEIIVTGGTSTGSFTPSAKGYIRAYISASGGWASSRKIWNQYAYNFVNINDDGTVPRIVTNPATRMAGSDGVFGNSDDLRPYNGYLQQQSNIDRYGERVWLAGEAAPVEASSNFSLNGEQAVVTVAVVNNGLAPIGSPLYLSLYKGTVSADNLIATGEADAKLLSGETAYVRATIPNINTINDLHIIARVNDNGTVSPFFAECTTDNNEMSFLNTGLRRLMRKDAMLNEVQHNGRFSNPVSWLYNEALEYKVTAEHLNNNAGTMTITDTLPAYTTCVNGSTVPSTAVLSTTTGITPERQILTWTFNGFAPMATQTVSFKTTPASGVCASQPLFVSTAWVRSDISPALATNSTYHQGAGVGIVTFSATAGGSIFGAAPQAVDYKTYASSGILVVPDEGYSFNGWSHNDYYSQRGKVIKAQDSIMNYDEILIYGDVNLRANFDIVNYNIRYYLNGSASPDANPLTYTVHSGVINLVPPTKNGDVFVGWTGSNGDTPQTAVTIPAGSTGDLVYFANFLRTGSETGNEIGKSDRVNTATPQAWANAGQLFVKAGNEKTVVRIFTVDGVQIREQSVAAQTKTNIPLQSGVYIVSLDGQTGKIVRI